MTDPREDIIGPDERYSLTFHLADVVALRPVDPDQWDVHLPGMAEPIRVKGRPWLAERWRELKGRAHG